MSRNKGKLNKTVQSSSRESQHQREEDELDRQKWEFPKIRGPDMDPTILGLLL